LHALEMSFLTYRDDGRRTLDLRQLAGAYGGAIIAEIPYPSRYSPLVQGVQNGHIQVGANVAINLFKEFSPELRRLNPFGHHATAQ
jgi:predicted DCC family thiol-disulfide oxidoreductase YuxK